MGVARILLGHSGRGIFASHAAETSYNSYFDVQMYITVVMHVADTVTNLAHVVDNFSLCHLVVLISDAIEQLTT